MASLESFAQELQVLPSTFWHVEFEGFEECLDLSLAHCGDVQDTTQLYHQSNSGLPATIANSTPPIEEAPPTLQTISLKLPVAYYTLFLGLSQHPSFPRRYEDLTQRGCNMLMSCILLIDQPRYGPVGNSDVP